MMAMPHTAPPPYVAASTDASGRSGSSRSVAPLNMNREMVLAESRAEADLVRVFEEMFALLITTNHLEELLARGSVSREEVCGVMSIPVVQTCVAVGPAVHGLD